MTTPLEELHISTVATVATAMNRAADKVGLTTAAAAAHCNMSSSAAASGNFGASIEVDAFTRARLSELAALRAAVQSGRGNRRVHQQVGWHLRRRTLSHSSRRAPASIRVAHIRELQAQGGGGGAAASAATAGPRGSRRLRKYRAKARFLRAHRALRNARPSRLETHEWHAKRFRMAPLPATDPARVVASASNDRGIRSAFRALSHACIAHDASYLDVVAVHAAAREPLFAALRAALLPQDAARALSAPVVAGARIARGLVARDPQSGRAIAPVDALFRPRADIHVVWLWAHPAASHAVAHVLRSVAGDAQVTLLRSEVLTFAVRGPRAGFVLGAVLARDDAAGPAWDVVRHARGPACAPACAVLAGEAVDPRANFPPKRVQEEARAGAQRVRELAAMSRDAFAEAPPDSRIWDADGRAACAPGRGGDGQTMPFMLIQRPSGLDRGLGAGWDVVVSKGWGRPLWRALMYANGARAAGMTEWRHFALETGDCVFPDDFPDSCQAENALREREQVLAERHARRPKSKRVNYGLYRVPRPFFPDLGTVAAPPAPTVPAATASDKRRGKSTDKLVAGRPKKRRRIPVPEEPSVISDATGTEVEICPKFRVLRERKEVRALFGRAGGALRFAQRKYVEVEAAEREMRALALEKSSALGPGTFVRASVRPMGRGTAVENALVCAPSEEDLAFLARGKFVEVLERLRRKGDEQPSRRCIGRVVHGNFSMARGGPIAVAFLKVDDVQKLAADCRAVPRERRGRRDEEGIQVRVLVRNVESLQYRLAVAAVSW